MPPVRLRTLLVRPDVLVIAFAGLLLRCWVLLTPSGTLFADEAVTGLSALDVSQGRPGILIPANNYTALVESYLFAPVVQVFGTHIVPLKLMGVVLWFGASLLAGKVAGRIGGERSSVVAFALLWLIPGALLIISTRAYLGYAGGLCVVMAAMLGLVTLAQEGLARRRVVLVGAAIGLAFIMHPIYLAGLGPAALVVTWRHRREIREWYAPVAVGFVAGCSPWLWWNLRNDFASFEEKDTEPSTYLERVRGNFTGLLPRDLGLRDLEGSWVLNRAVGIGLTVLMVLAFLWAIRALWRLGDAGRVLAVPAAVTWFTLAVFAHSSFVLDGRYGILPFTASLLALGTALGRTRPRPRLALVGVAAWSAVFVLPYQVEVVGTKLGDPNQVTTDIARALDARGVNHLIGDYFDVLQVSYLTEGYIATKVFFPLPVRYPHLEARVDQASPDRVAFLFHAGGLRETDLKLPLESYERVDLPGYELYVPYEGAG